MIRVDRRVDWPTVGREGGSWTTSLARPRVTLGCILALARRSMHVDRAISDPGARRRVPRMRMAKEHPRESIVNGQVFHDALFRCCNWKFK